MDKFKRFVLQMLPRILSALLVFMIVLSTVDLYLIKDIAKIINLTGSLRGMSQQLVKQEVLGHPNDQLREDITQLLQDLQEGGEAYGIKTPLQNVEYQNDLSILNRYWPALQGEIDTVRVTGPEGTEILYVSDHFHEIANRAVYTSQAYSDQITKDLIIIEGGMILCALLIIGLSLFSSIQNRKLSNANSELSHTAFLDKHTGLPNKSKCEELLNAPGELDLSTACVMFDLNNLKKVNDAMGHQAGDNMIRDFAQLLRKAVPPTEFAGRYGGDEFVVIMNGVTPGEVDAFLEKLAKMTVDHNRSGTQLMSVIPLSYAAGFAHSAQVPNSTMASLLKAADANMYANKAKMKAALGKEEQASFR